MLTTLPIVTRYILMMNGLNSSMKGGGGSGGSKGSGAKGGGTSGPQGGGKGGAGQGKGPGNAGGWPSTTGKPSGCGRSNNPPSK